jgi:hypothetical protein
MPEKPIGAQASNTTSIDSLADSLFDHLSRAYRDRPFTRDEIFFALIDVITDITLRPQFVTGPLLCPEHDTALPCPRCQSGSTIPEPWIAHD